MREVVSERKQEDEGDGFPREWQTTVGRGMVRLTDSHVTVCGHKHCQSYCGRLSHEDERVRVQSGVVPRHRSDPFAGVHERDYIVDRELNQPDDI